MKQFKKEMIFKPITMKMNINIDQLINMML